MTEKEILIKKLETFKYHIFSKSINFFELDFEAFKQDVNQCVDELKNAVSNNVSLHKLKKIITPYITHLRHLRIIETEEREYVTWVYYELSQIISVDITFQLNRVIYGWLLTALTTNPFKKKKKWLETVSIKKSLINKCTSCNYEMITNIINYQDQGDSDTEVNMHAIVACKVCGELNLIFITEDGDLAHSYDYYMKEELPDSWTIERAKQRIEQIKHWRSN